MSTKTKTQLLRTARLVLWMFGSACLPYVLNWHGPVSIIGLEAPLVAAAEVTFRHFFPTDASLVAVVEAQVNKSSIEAGIKVPPAVF